MSRRALNNNCFKLTTRQATLFVRPRAENGIVSCHFGAAAQVASSKAKYFASPARQPPAAEVPFWVSKSAPVSYGPPAVMLNHHLQLISCRRRLLMVPALPLPSVTRHMCKPSVRTTGEQTTSTKPTQFAGRCKTLWFWNLMAEMRLDGEVHSEAGWTAADRQ